jgi:hypothetical protein
MRRTIIQIETFLSHHRRPVHVTITSLDNGIYAARAWWSKPLGRTGKHAPYTATAQSDTAFVAGKIAIETLSQYYPPLGQMRNVLRDLANAVSVWRRSQPVIPSPWNL